MGEMACCCKLFLIVPAMCRISPGNSIDDIYKNHGGVKLSKASSDDAKGHFLFLQNHV